MAYVWITVKFLRKLSQTYQAMHRSFVSLACSRRSNLVWDGVEVWERKTKTPCPSFLSYFFAISDFTLHSTTYLIAWDFHNKYGGDESDEIVN